jgi:hypothetical protein
MIEFTRTDLVSGQTFTIDDALLKSILTDSGFTLYDALQHCINNGHACGIVRLMHFTFGRVIPVGYLIEYAKLITTT